MPPGWFLDVKWRNKGSVFVFVKKLMSCCPCGHNKMQRPGRWWVRGKQRDLYSSKRSSSRGKVFSNGKRKEKEQRDRQTARQDKSREVARLGNRNRANWGTGKRSSWTKLPKMSLSCATSWAAIYICVLYGILAGGFTPISVWPECDKEGNRGELCCFPWSLGEFYIGV